MASHHYAQNAGLRQRKKALRAEALTRSPRQAPRAMLGARNQRAPFSPPEEWHEPNEAGDEYRIVVRSPGAGYRHIVTPADVRQRLAQVPQHFLKGLEVVQLASMTRKKQSFPCYGMQWGSTLYLYPIEETLEEHFVAPPRPEIYNEARMYGGRWDEPGPGWWRLTWTEAAIRDFYLNNILIHELGHLVDDRNTTYQDRERYAEWFAVEHGYRATGGAAARQRSGRRRRRHHGQ
ncbi:MAG: hypothetical protein KDA44_15760 [Planctomycetales bacterium]|nr:hypothetical protein [Planctomycetales bacterium]